MINPSPDVTGLRFNRGALVLWLKNDFVSLLRGSKMNWVDNNSQSQDMQVGEVTIHVDRKDLSFNRDEDADRAPQTRDQSSIGDRDQLIHGPDKSLRNRDLIFHAVISPHRSASMGQIHIIMGAMGALALVLGIGFITAGAWPITGFIGAEVLLVYLALSFHHGGKNAREELTLDRDKLTITRLGPWRMRRNWHLSPRWLQVMIESQEKGRDRLILRNGQASVVIGACLSDMEKIALAQRLRFALAKVPMSS